MFLFAESTASVDSILRQPPVIGAAIAAGVAIVALIVNTIMAYLQWQNNRNQLAEAKRKERRELARRRLDEFYGPLWYYLLTTKGLFTVFGSILEYSIRMC